MVAKFNFIFLNGMAQTLNMSSLAPLNVQVNKLYLLDSLSNPIIFS